MSIFKEVAEEYFKFLKYCSENNLYNSEYIINDIDKQFIRDAKKYETNTDHLNNIYTRYNMICTLSELDYTEWFKQIILYNEFLNYLGYAYMHNITKEDSDITISRDGTGICVDKHVKSEFNKRTIEISFEDSEILQIGLDSSTDPLTNFIENGSKGKPNDTITFVNILANSELCNKEFRFVIGEEPDVKCEDRILLTNIKKYVSRVIKTNFIELVETTDIVSANSDRVSLYYFMEYIIKPQIIGDKKVGFLWF